MKITDIEVIRMQANAEPSNNWLSVRVHTDAGITGLGEGSLQYKDAALTAEIEAFALYLRGQDPFQIEHIWTSLFRRTTWSGGAVTMSAISAIDLALWDIKGKALGVPVYELVGGKVRDRVPLYANGWFVGERPSAHGPQGGAGLSLHENLSLQRRAGDHTGAHRPGYRSGAGRARGRGAGYRNRH